jgi:hypothetical protein
MAHSKALTPSYTLLTFKVEHAKGRGSNCHARTGPVIFEERKKSTEETTTVACAPWESIQKAKRREQTAQQCPFVSFPVGPTVIRCSGVAARKGQSVEVGYRFSPLARPKTGPSLKSRQGLFNAIAPIHGI